MLSSKKDLASFQVGVDYQLLDVIGEGAYGVVCSAIHKPTGRKVAIKKVSPFKHPLFALRTLREIKILRYFQHENVINILDILKPSSYESFNEVYLIQELMGTDLHRVIRTQELTDDHCQYFIYQIFRALKFLHSANIIHRDLKPSNLLVNANCDLKICDFGLARTVHEDPFFKSMSPSNSRSNSSDMTEYVATRWYRAPELMLSTDYSSAMDIWSVGCIFSELLTSQPLFPGTHHHHQLQLMCQVLGSPSPDMVTSKRGQAFLTSLSKLYPPASTTTTTTTDPTSTCTVTPTPPITSLESLHPQASPLALDLLHHCLQYHPNQRITAHRALHHPYVHLYHDPQDEPRCAPIPPRLFAFDLHKDILSKEQLKLFLYKELHTPQSVYLEARKLAQLKSNSGTSSSTSNEVGNW